MAGFRDTLVRLARLRGRFDRLLKSGTQQPSKAFGLTGAGRLRAPRTITATLGAA